MFLVNWDPNIGGAFVVYSLAVCALIYALTPQRAALRHIPGPFLAQWTPLWLAYQAYRGQRYAAVHRAHQYYGAIVRIAPNHVSIASPDALPVIYGYGPNAPPKSPFYDAFVGNGKPSLFSTRDRQDHSKKRRAVSHAFSISALREYFPLIQISISRFTERMDELCEKEEFFDALPWFHYLAFDIVSDLVFGKPIGMVDNGSGVVSIQQSHNLSVTTENAIALVEKREHFAAVVGTHAFFQWAASLMKFLPGHKATVGLEELARSQVLKRLSYGTNRKDILGKLIETRGYDGHSPSNDEIDELISESLTFLIAGSDTASDSIAAILHFIFTHPRVHKKLLGLLEDVAAGSKDLSYEQAKEIPYLQATINEGLRLHSTNSIGLHRLAPSGGLIYREKFLPEGTELSVPAWTINHSQSLWGDPETFRPERWLEEKKLDQYLLTFGKGPRACIGKNLACIEMTLVIATILLRYEIEVRFRELKTTEGFMHKPLNFWIKLRSKN